MQDRAGVALLVGDAVALRRAAPADVGADGEATGQVEVLVLRQLLAVVEDRGAGQGEGQRVDHLEPLAVVPDHRRQPEPQPPPEDLVLLARAEGREDLGELVLGQLVERQLVVVADEDAEGLAGRQLGSPAEGGQQRAGVLPGQRQVHPLVEDEVEAHRHAGARPAEEVELLVVGEVDLAEHDRLARAAGHEGPHEVEHLEGLRQRPRVAPQAPVHRLGERAVALVVGVALPGGGLDEVRHGVDAEADDAQLQPEAHDAADLVADLGVRRVEVRLVAVEAVPEVLARLLVVGPDRVLLAREEELGVSSAGSGSSRHTYQSR